MKRCLYSGWLLSPPNALKGYLESRGIELVLQMKQKNSEEELMGLVADAEASIIGGDNYPRRVIGSASKLKIIAIVGVGFDRVDVSAATERGIQVTTTPIPELACGMAEDTMALILSLVKRIPQRNAELRAGIWETARWRGEIQDLYHLTIGLFGLGRIGSEVAKRAHAFGMSIIYYDVLGRADLEKSLGIKRVSFEELLLRSDVLSVHAPLTAETRNIIDAKALSKMKRTAIVINTARGAIIDEKALAVALRDGKVAGAAVDVFSQEPLTPTHPFHALGDLLPNLLLTPHGGAGQFTLQAQIRAAADEVVSVLEGREPRYPLNEIRRPQ